MTAPVPAFVHIPAPPARREIGQPSPHCTGPGCKRTDTATVDGRWGRRCDTHPPVFDPAYAVHLARVMGPEAAFTYCRTELQ